MRTKVLVWLMVSGLGCARAPVAPAVGGWEGFYAPAAVTPSFLRNKGIPTGVTAPLDRVGKFILVLPPRTVPRAEHQRLTAFYCAAGDARAWNGVLCDALDSAACDGDVCTYVHHGNCSGFLAGEGVFLTAAHCLADLLDAPERLAASHVLLPSGNGPPRRLAVTLVTTGKREFSTHWVAQKEIPVDVAVLRVDDGGLAAHPRARVQPADVLHMVGSPRAEQRSAQARARHGYQLVPGIPAVAFGVVADVNRNNTPLCSPSGRQEDWVLRAPCPYAQVSVDGETAYQGVLLTHVFTSTMDSINGFSGAPVFNAAGALVGINSTIMSTQNPQEVYPPGFRAVATHVQDALAALEAR